MCVCSCVFGSVCLQCVTSLFAALASLSSLDSRISGRSLDSLVISQQATSGPGLVMWSVNLLELTERRSTYGIEHCGWCWCTERASLSTNKRLWVFGIRMSECVWMCYHIDTQAITRSLSTGKISLTEKSFTCPVWAKCQNSSAQKKFIIMFCLTSRSGTLKQKSWMT